MADPLDLKIQQRLQSLGPTGKPGQTPVGATPDLPPDAFDAGLQQRLQRLAPPSSISGQTKMLEYDPNADWDSFREAFDAAVFGQYSKADPAREKARDSWAKGNPGKMYAADFVGSVTPGTLLGIGAGQAVFRAGMLAENMGAPALNSMAKFLTGTSTGNRLMQGLSKLAQGAGQGAIQSGYEKFMGQPTDLGANMILGAGGNVASHIAFAPQYSNIAPGVQNSMREWSRMNLAPTTAQLPGASPVAKLWGKFFGPNPVSMEDVTARLMRTVGSSDTRMTPQNIARARQAIKQGLGSPFNQMADGDVAKQINAALGLGNNPSARQQQLRQALAQWNNADVLERVAASSGPDGIATPRALLSAAGAAARRGTTISPEINQLATGAQYFAGRGEKNPLAGAGVGALGIGGAEALDYAMPFLEHAVPGLPGLAHAGTIYGGVNAVLGVPGAIFQNTPLYRSLVAGGGVGPGVNPLVVGLMQNQNYQERVQPLKSLLPNPGDFIMPAQGKDAGIQAGADASGLDPRYVRAIASIESDQNPFSNRYKATQYKGLFQLNNEEFQANGGGDIYNAEDNARAFGGIAKSNADWFRSRFGRDPTPTQIYMMHLQGRGFYESGKLTNVAGNPYPGMSGPQTPQSFEAGWGRELERRANALAGIQVSAGPTSSGLTSVLQPITGAGPSQDEISNVLAGSQ